MEVKPLLIVQSVRPITARKAQKSIERFLQSQLQCSVPSLNLTKREQENALPDDVMNKLMILSKELSSLEAEDTLASPNSQLENTNKKKRKKDSREDVDKEDKAEKKKRKDKKDRHRGEDVKIETVAVTAAVVPTEVKDNRLQNMKKALMNKTK